MLRLVRVEARPDYHLWLRYADGVQGEVDLSKFVGHGVFAAWERPGAFERVRIDEYGALAWDGEVELDPDALYLELTGKTAAEIFPALLPTRRAVA